MLSCELNVNSVVRHLRRCSGHVLHSADEGGGFEPEQSCRFLFQMVRVSSPAQSFLFLFATVYLVIS